MPIYEYLCESCGRITELMQKVSDPPPTTCGECGAPRLAKLVSRSAFQLKGGGWYADLYSSRKDGSGGKGASTASSGGSTGASPAPASTPSAPASAGSSGSSGSGSGSSGSSGSGGAS